MPSMTHASNLRPVGVSKRSIRGARSLNFGSMRLLYMSGGSTMWESAEMSLYAVIVVLLFRWPPGAGQVVTAPVVGSTCEDGPHSSAHLGRQRVLALIGPITRLQNRVPRERCGSQELFNSAAQRARRSACGEG